MALAYPSADISPTTYVAKEAFITVLSDNKLQIEVMKKEPRNIEEALSHAIKLEAFEQSLLLTSCNSAGDSDEGHSRWRPKHVISVSFQFAEFQLAKFQFRLGLGLGLGLGPGLGSG